MREKLKNLNGQRITVTATFKRFGSKTAYKGPPIKTLLFTDVRGTAGELLTDHLWFNMAECWEGLHLEPGHRVQFDARTKSYTKGYRGWRVDEEDMPSVETDYKLSFPSRCKNLSTATQKPVIEEELELFKLPIQE